ncbi:hypothetical protein [Desulfosarcina cetonica]|uniref:hypothetical protein n=1 Tax=Desulfosarcina cetonica TaxID=90730 RepID=UPI0012ECCAE8|nr:hypothetical protein [Desulfosarcina cetonica]
MRFRQPYNRSILSLQSRLVIGGMRILLVPMTVIDSVTFIKSSRTLQFSFYLSERLAND